MSKKNKGQGRMDSEQIRNKIDQFLGEEKDQSETDAESGREGADGSDETMVSFVSGSSIIDIGELRRAQLMDDADLEDDATDLTAKGESTDEADLEDENLDMNHLSVSAKNEARIQSNLRARALPSDAEVEAEALSLNEEAKLLMAEMDNDPELKKDVLSDFEETESNDDLSRIASSIDVQNAEQVKIYEALASDVSDELKALNETFILEDKLLESAIAEELALEASAEALTANESKLKNRGKKSKEKAAGAASKLSAKLSAKLSVDSSDAAFDADAADDFKEPKLDEDGLEIDEVEAEEMSEHDQELLAALPKVDEDGNYDLEDLQSCVEALLLYSDRPVSLKKLKEMLEMTEAEDTPILQAIELLKNEFSARAHGFEVAEIAGGYQLRTKPSKAALLRKLAKIQIQRLSRGAMETLTIVSYKQPCTKDDIDQVRGVDSSHFIRTLLDRKLIEVSGRSENAGRPMIYSTTDTFLEVFGLMDLKGLPPLREIEAMVPQMAAAEDGAEDPRVVQMRKLVHQMKVDSNHLDYNPREDDKILQEIRERVKSIDISTPYLERQKQLATEGITGEAAELILTREFNFDKATSGGEEILESEARSELSLEASNDENLVVKDLVSDENSESQNESSDS
jgi:segregation and condensation protein B